MAVVSVSSSEPGSGFRAHLAALRAVSDEPVTLADAQSFEDWVADHVAVMSAVAIRQVGPADADDVVQEALTRAWTRRQTYRPDAGSVRAWLVAIVLDRARRHRMRSLRPTLPALGDHASAAGTDVDGRLLVEGAVRQLPRRQREVITLFYLADLSVTDIGHVLGISASAVKVALHAGRDTLRRTLESKNDA
jgi:RNA polymerase sigma factor (sigma-70 family)